MEGNDRDQLAEILFDATLREAFYNHLDSCLMAELLDLWIQLENFFELEDERKKVEQFMLICKEFILANSPPTPSTTLTTYLQNLEKYIPKSLKKALFLTLSHRTFLNLVEWLLWIYWRILVCLFF